MIVGNVLKNVITCVWDVVRYAVWYAKDVLGCCAMLCYAMLCCCLLASLLLLLSRYLLSCSRSIT